MPRDVLTRRVPAPGDLLGGALMATHFTLEQAAAIERRSGTLLLDAGAGSGKTSVLVERYARAVEEDGVEPGAILAITFTEKAAAEMRQRVRARLKLTEDPGWILTIHGFCARVLRANALEAGLDPQFTVLDEDAARELSDAAFDLALAAVADTPDGAELIAAHRVGDLRGAILAAYRQLRSMGERHPRLPVVVSPVATTTAAEVRELADAVARELGSVDDPGVTIQRALDMLAACHFETDWPGDLPELATGANALKTDTCERYREALAALRRQLGVAIAVRMRDGLDALLSAYGAGYEAAKRERGAVDFDDLELLARDVLSGGHRYAFAHVMVDELQDTNAVQLALVDLVAAGDPVLFMVGDAQQSIYGFRHADVSLFRARGRALGDVGGRLALRTNFRTRAEILTVLNAGFEALLEDFMALAPGREDTPATDRRVELIIADKTAEWADDEGLATPWRAAEARALAARVAALISAGECRAGDVVVLTRATTDLRVYERALEAAGVATFVVGGRGYWNHPQVVELVAYLRALANPLDQEQYWTVLISPLCGLSLDGLVLVAAGADDELGLEDAGRLARFERFFAEQRRASLRVGAEQLIDHVLDWSGYDLALAGMPDGRRRLANVRKLMRLAREWEGAHGPDLAGFVGLLARRGGAGTREGEAPVESEALDAVRLMTIHRSKGLEFPVVCVADLGRGPAWDSGLVRLGGDRLGLRISQPGVGVRVEALSYRELRDESVAAERAEQRRLFYVAMTRAQERLILSGAARSDRPPRSDSLTPIDWIAPAFRELDGVDVTDLSEDGTLREVVRVPPEPASLPVAGPPVEPLVGALSAVESLSYSGLSLYERCGYRFYAERVLGLAAVATASTGARARGVEIHARLAAGEYGEFEWNETFARVRAAREVRSEQSFAFALGGTLLTGVFDVIGVESDRLLVVDYKSDALRGRAPEEIVLADYETQRLIYALAALRTGAARVEVVHLFLADVGEPSARVYEAVELSGLEAEVAARVAGVVSGDFRVTDEPHRGVCAGCPAAGTLCPVPEALRNRTLLSGTSAR